MRLSGKSAADLHPVQLFKAVPVLRKGPGAVPHGVGVLAQNARPLLAGAAVRIKRTNLLHARIHGTDDIRRRGLKPAPFVLHDRKSTQSCSQVSRVERGVSTSNLWCISDLGMSTD